MRRRQAPLWPLMALTVAIALMAFILSFDALRTLAVACGVQPGLSWMFPLIIDAPVLAFTWATWVFKTRGLGQAYPWAMLLVFSAVSLVGNALHAHPVETNGLLLPDWGASLLMTMPPVALLATSHMIVRAASRSFDMDGPEPAAEAVPDVPRDMDDPAPVPKAPVEAEPAAEAVETTPVAPPEVPRDTDGPEMVSEAPAETGAARWHPDFSAPIPGGIRTGARCPRDAGGALGQGVRGRWPRPARRPHRAGGILTSSPRLKPGDSLHRPDSKGTSGPREEG